MVTADALKLLHDGWLINIGRGSPVDADELLDALWFGQVRGAGPGVVFPEPMPASLLFRTLEKVIVTCHSAGRRKDYGHRWGEKLSADMIAFREDCGWINLGGQV